MSDYDGFQKLKRRTLVYGVCLALLLAMIVFAIFMLGKAHADAIGPGLPKCTSHSDMMSRLLRDYKELAVEQGLANNSDGVFIGLAEWTVNRRAKSFTMVLTNMADGQTCFLMSGRLLDAPVTPPSGASPGKVEKGT